MPLTPSSFFIPPAGVPFIVEDKYIRGGFRTVNTIAERDAIAVASRKVGMKVLVADASFVEYELKGGTGNANWQVSTSAPKAHSHVASEITDLSSAVTGVVNAMRGGQSGLAYLLDGKIDPSLIPALSIGNTFVVNSESEMLAVAAGKGDVAVRPDIESSFILVTEPPTALANWQQLLSPTSDIISVNGQTGGTIVIDASSIGAASLTHTHAASDITDLALALNAKAPTIHSHAASDISDLTPLLETKAAVNHTHAVNDVTGLQSALDGKAASAHNHTLLEVSGLTEALADKASYQDLNTGLLDKATKTELSAGLSEKASIQSLSDGLAGKADTLHNHTIAQVTNLQSELDGKALVDHTHTQSEVVGLVEALDGKASTVHAHAISDVTGLQTAIDGKASTVHAHAISDVTGLQTVLDGKAQSDHVHAVATTSADGLLSAADKTKLNSIASNANNYVHPTSDGSLHVPATGTTNNAKVLKAGATAGSLAWASVSYSELSGIPATFAPSAHAHSITDVTGLQTALDGKLAATGTAANSSQLQGYTVATGATISTIALRDGAGKITAVDFTMTSDIRLKDIVNKIDDDEALAQVLSWESVRYTMKDGDGRVMPGFIAQQIKSITPELVIDTEEYLSVSYALTSAYYAAAFRAVVKRLERIGA